jgi:serine/threonine-protein kinase
VTREVHLDAKARERVEELWQAALEIPAAERRAFLHRSAGHDEALRAELESLLSCEDGAATFFSRLAPLVDAGVQDALMQSLLEEMRAALAGRYALERELGQGGMATVFLARDLRHERNVALKVLHPELPATVLGDPFEREIRLTAQLNHPHILPLLDSGEIVREGDSGNRIWYTMPCVSGESLRHHLARHAPLSLSEVVRIAADVADALDHAHRQGFVHLDIKPENILLQDGHAVVADFGIARAINSVGQRAGTGAYMSPEQIAGAEVDGRTDVFSLGCVIHEMLTGHAPQIGNGLPPVSAARSDAFALEPVIHRATARNAADRFATARELRAALMAVETGQEPTRGVPEQPHPRRRLLFVVATAVVLLAAVLALWRSVSPSARAPAASAAISGATRAASPTVAVLPLANRSADAGDAAWADGLTEELITILSRAGMRVTSSASAFMFRNHGSDLRSIADSLRVSSILAGDVQKTGSRLLVHLRLVDARDGSTRWSNTYDREFHDLVSLQAEIVGSVAGELGIQLPADKAGIQRGQTQNIAAYELYVRALDPALYRSDAAARQKLRYLQEVIALDPDFAAAHAQLASTYRRLGGRSALALAEEAALEAIALDDSLSEAHSALAAVRLVQHDFASAEEHLRIALDLDPGNRYTVVSLVTLNTWFQRPEQALIEAERALAIDPLSANALGEVAQAWLLNDRCDKALPLAEQLAALQPPLLRAGVIAAQCYARRQNWQQAMTSLQRAAANDGQRRQALIAYMLARAGDKAGARRIEEALLERWQRSNEGAFSIAIVHAGLGDFDETFKWLDRSIDDGSVASLIMEPLFEDVRRDPRFAQLTSRLNLPKR